MSVPDNINEVVEAAETPSLTYKVDFESGRIVGMVDGIAAVEQAIRLALMTPRFECLIYSDQYGSEVRGALSDTEDEVDEDYLRTVLPQMIEDALMADSRIIEVGDIEMEFDGDEVHVEFTVTTIFGNTSVDMAL